MPDDVILILLRLLLKLNGKLTQMLIQKVYLSMYVVLDLLRVGDFVAVQVIDASFNVIGSLVALP